MWTSAQKATVGVSRFVSTWWAATSAAAERDSSSVTTSTPASKDPKVGHINSMCCPLRGLISALVNWNTVWPWICVSMSWCFSNSKCYACWRQQCDVALVVSAVHRAPWVYVPAVNTTLLSGAFIALEVAQWSQLTQLWMKIQIQGKITPSTPK